MPVIVDSFVCVGFCLILVFVEFYVFIDTIRKIHSTSSSQGRRVCRLWEPNPLKPKVINKYNISNVTFLPTQIQIQIQIWRNWMNGELKTNPLYFNSWLFLNLEFTSTASISLFSSSIRSFGYQGFQHFTVY